MIERTDRRQATSRWALSTLSVSVCLLATACDSSNDGRVAEPAYAPAAEPYTTLPFYDDADFTPKWLPRSVVDAPAFHRIPPFRFTNQNGEEVTEKAYDGKIYVVDFFFTTCGGICPVMTRNLGKVQKAYFDDDDVRLLSHTVTPQIDRVPMLKTFAEQYSVKDGKWNLVTGARREIYDIARRFYFADEDLGEKDESDFLHTENFILVDKERRIRGVYNGTRVMDIKRLIEDIALLKKEYE